MNPSPTRKRLFTPSLLIAGLLLAVGLMVLPACDSPQNPATGTVKLTELTYDNWQKEVMESKIPVVVDFTAEWCGPCKILAPTIQKLADRYEGKVKVCKFDVGDRSLSKGRKLVDEYRIGGFPCVLIFKDGELRKEFMGVQPEANFVQEINKVL